MDKQDTRRKITFYLNPETNAADKYVCDEIDRTPQGERGKLWRSALLAGFALRKQDARLPHMLAELLNEETTFDEVILLMKAVFPEEMDTFGERRPAAPVTTVSKTTAAVTQKGSAQDETRNNARNMFGQ
ncbi:plasmid partitioning/stability family protein [Cronobacter sakazakii]|uniref:plasmid partitioning/stability family protein n=1 Tax=Cronobacter sakazakii TaxID=28141 RepID=UPI000DA13F23|nr:plasmid partitioning/stability family protein [Cronobacter sakazakii]ELY7546192.1 plasmid partitioning/stability family protein [Cronobacter turicensis]